MTASQENNASMQICGYRTFHCMLQSPIYEKTIQLSQLGSTPYELGSSSSAKHTVKIYTVKLALCKKNSRLTSVRLQPCKKLIDAFLLKKIINKYNQV